MTNYTTLSLTASVKSLVFILSILGTSTFGYNQQIQLDLSSGETQTLELTQANGMQITGQGTLKLVCGSQGIQITESLVLGNQVKLVCDETIHLVGSGILQASRLNSNISIQGEWELRSDLTLKPEKEAHFHNATINLGSSSIVSDNLIFSGVNLIHTNGGVIVANKSFLSNEQLEVESSQADVIFIPELAEFTGSTDLPVHFFSSAGNPCGDPEFEITVEVISDYNGVDISCNGADDAEVQCVVTGGVGPFVCEWFGGTGDNTGETYSGLGAGTYTVLVTDEGQNVICVENVQIAEPPPLAVFTLNLMMPSCDALCNGSTNPIVLGGTGLYTFDYSNGGMDQENLNLCAGVNSIMISDVNNCQLDTTFVINEDSIDIDLLYTDSLCFGDNFGVASVSPSGGGGGPYDIDWSTNEATNAISNLSSGTYSVGILYAEDCSIDSTFTIVGLGELIVTIDESENPVCISDNNGIISVSISGGSPEYTLAWTKEGVPFSIEEDLSDLGIGLYELSVTDAFGCTGSLSLSLEAQEEVLVETTLVEIDCFENCNASITSTVIQAQEPVTFTWSDVNGIISNAEFIENICAGTYELVVLDGTGCEYIETFIIDEPEGIEVLEDITNISCNGLAEGMILLTVSGGSAPYSTSLPSIEANPGEFGLDNLIAGSYVVDVTDDEGCVVSVPFELIEPETLLVDLSFEDPNCFGESSGSITLIVSGGSEPYSIEWVELGVFDELNLSDLPSGDYNIIITDAQGCEDSLTVILEDPLEIAVLETTNPVLCNGGNTGSISLEVSGGLEPYTPVWTPVLDASLAQENLTAGVYEVTLTDDNGCEFNNTFEITAPDEIIITEEVSVLNCSEDLGAIEISIEGGIEPYDISWVGIEASGETLLTELSAGDYSVTVIDDSECEVTEGYTITVPEAIEIVEVITQPNCFGELGVISLEITGGTGLYSIEWTGVEADGDTEILDLIAGTYTVTVTDENGCEEEESYEIILINELAANVNMTQPECFTLNGEAVLAIEGGTEPYSIIWPGIAADDELSASEIAPGSYTVSITDANLCTIEVEFEITEPYELSVETIFNNVLCNGENTGSIDITLTNSTGVIDYNWVNEELGFTSPTQDIENLFAGAYELTATDEIGCVLNETFETLETEELVITLENIQSETCYGLGNGSIEVSISGGTLDYQINWSGTGFSSNDEDILELASGDYTLNISDLNGCAASEIFTVNSGALIAPNISSIDSECSESTGSISVNIDSDNPIEDISWFDDGVLLTDGLITTIENISSGMYSVEITDDQGCSVSETILISDTDALSINADVNGVNCLGDSNGSILIIVTSGTEPYTLTWSGPVEIADDQYNPTNLTAGDYIASITDAEGCNALQEFSVLSPDSFSINETIINVSCFGNGDGVIALELIGGTEPFTIDWMDSDEDLDTLTNLTPGEYGVLITDANDCITEGTYEITEEDVLTLDISFTELFCVNQTSTDIDITVTGGLEPYTFSWTGEVTSTNEDLADAGIGTYTVLVTDAVNCTIEETITIAQGSEILIEVIETQPTCLTNNGSLTASAVGGSGLDYTFFWYSTGDTPALLGQEPTLDNLESGSYYLEVYDSAGCFNTAEVNLSNNQGEVTTNITNVLCAQDDSGSIEIEVVGLVGTLSVEWAGPNNFTSVDEDISGLTEGEYTVTVTDSNGCQLIETYEVESTNQLVEGIEITNICFGETGTGAIDILVTGGTAPYIISWTGNGLVSDQTSITDLNEGCYILEILDANSCLYIEEVCITSLDEIILNTSVTGNVCFADEQGQIELEISGGDPDYSVEWLNSDAEFVSDQVTVTQLATGVYTASIIDNSGCMANITASITSSPELTAEVSETPIICFGDENGALDVVYSGGVGALTLTWTGPNGFTSEEDQILNLGNGDYCYEVVGSVGCVISDCYALNNPELLNLNQTVNSISCFGANDGEISLEVTGGYTPYITDWTLNDSPFSTDEDISDLTIGEYAVTLSDSMGCIIEETFTVSEPTELTINFDNIVGATCPTSSDGAVEISASGGMLDYSYSWVLNGTEESIEEDPLELNAGDYQLTVTDANECITEIASVIIPALGTVEIIVPENISWCFTEDLQLIEPISAIAQSVEWTYPPSADVLSTTSSVFFQEEPGVYELVITGTDGPCVMTSTVEITIYEVPLADAGEDQEAELEDEVILGGNPTTDDFNTVAWTPFELLNESSLFNPSYVVVNSIQTFILTVTSPEGCVSEDSAQVILYPEIDIHSGFTPNSDNINDVWVIGNLQNYPSIEVWVYNRWGEELFYSKGYNQPWDGTYNGNSLPIGTYYYVIDFNKPGLQLTADGPVTILR